MKIRMRGFALIEVLCAVFIATALTGICVFRFDSREVKIEAFARSLCSDIRYVRLKNMSSDYTTLIKYEILEDGRNAYILMENGKVVHRVALPRDTDIYHSVRVIKFTCTGALSSRGETIRINDTKSGKDTILTIVPFSGRVLIKEGIYEEQ